MTAYSEEIRLPNAPGWDYGGVLFGLEPLVLPPRWMAPDGDLTLGEWSWPLSPGELETARANDPDLLLRLFWFRWITGHQTTFILWQLLAAVLTTGSAASQPEAVRRARILVRGCSLMLLYAGSPPRAIYGSIIRPAMARQHPHLSGSWAPDFHAVRGALRGRIPFDDGSQTRALLAECEMNGCIHRCIGQKLVPDGPSMLQMASREDARRWHTGMLRVLYDSTFMTIRAVISYETVVVQLLRRLRAMYFDVSANTLYPAGASSEEEEPPEMRAASITDCKNTFLRDLDLIVRVATTIDGSQAAYDIAEA